MSQSNELSINKQLEVLSLSKGSYYYKPKGESEFNEKVMNEIDRIHTQNPARGVVGMMLDLMALGGSVSLSVSEASSLKLVDLR